VDQINRNHLIIINVNLYCTEAVMAGFQLSKEHLIIWQFCLFPYGPMLYLSSTLDNTNPLFALADQEPANGNLYAD